MNVSEFTLIFAFRYALGRMDSASSYVVNDLKRNWDNFNDTYKRLIKEEIKEAMKENRTGMSWNVENWNEILKLEDYECNDVVVKGSKKVNEQKGLF
jgi:hypothetical protein